MTFLRRFVPLCLVFVTVTPLAAQDAHYWTEQYGNRPRLLAGAVIGSSTDLASVYYNPGALALVENPELLLSANVYQYTDYSLKTDDDLFQNLDQGRVGAAPSLFAGEIKFGFLGQTRFGYSVLTRYSTDLRLEGAVDVQDDDRIGIVGLTELAGAIQLEEKITETWVGFTFARPLGDHWGLGVSPYVTVRSQRTGSNLTAQAQDTTGNVALALNQNQTKFNNWRLLAKIGASAVYGPWRFGATITTPSLKVFGSGSVYATRSFVAQDGPGSINALVEDDLPANYRSPLTVGAGAGYRWNSSSVNVAMEYFSRIDSARVMNVGSVVDERGDTLTVDIVQQLKPVFNVAFGYQYEFSENLEGYGGFRTDFSARVDDPEKGTFPIAGWDIYHVSGGATFDLGRSHFTLGAILAFGGGPSERITIGPGDSPPIETDATVSYFRATVILGFSVFFN